MSINSKIKETLSNKAIVSAALALVGVLFFFIVYWGDRGTALHRSACQNSDSPIKFVVAELRGAPEDSNLRRRLVHAIDKAFSDSLYNYGTEKRLIETCTVSKGYSPEDLSTSEQARIVQNITNDLDSLGAHVMLWGEIFEKNIVQIYVTDSNGGTVSKIYTIDSSGEIPDELVKNVSFSLSRITERSGLEALDAKSPSGQVSIFVKPLHSTVSKLLEFEEKMPKLGQDIESQNAKYEIERIAKLFDLFGQLNFLLASEKAEPSYYEIAIENFDYSIEISDLSPELRTRQCNTKLRRVIAQYKLGILSDDEPLIAKSLESIDKLGSDSCLTEYQMLITRMNGSVMRYSLWEVNGNLDSLMQAQIINAEILPLIYTHPDLDILDKIYALNAEGLVSSGLGDHFLSKSEEDPTLLPQVIEDYDNAYKKFIEARELSASHKFSIRHIQQTSNFAHVAFRLGLLRGNWENVEEAYNAVLSIIDKVAYDERPDDWRRIRTTAGNVFYAKAAFNKDANLCSQSREHFTLLQERINQEEQTIEWNRNEANLGNVTVLCGDLTDNLLLVDEGIRLLRTSLNRATTQSHDTRTITNALVAAEQIQSRLQSGEHN